MFEYTGPTRKVEPKLSMIVVMGATGAGKSRFINTLAGKKVTNESDSLYSCTQSCLPIPVKIGATTILVIDTPGFDDGNRTDTEILTEIARILVAQYKLGVELKGIIYLHRITNDRYTGSAIKTLNIFQRICGDGSLKNVMLVTSGWTKENQDVCSRKEQELREDFWSYMIDRESQMRRFYGDRQSAFIIASQLTTRRPIVLQLQRELIIDGRGLRDTSAGSYLYGNLEILMEEHVKTLATLAELKCKYRPGSAGLKRVETDLAAEQKRAQQTQGQKEGLHRPVVDEVEEEIHLKRKSFLAALPAIIPILTLALDVLFGLLGIPTGFSLLSA